MFKDFKTHIHLYIHSCKFELYVYKCFMTVFDFQSNCGRNGKEFLKCKSVGVHDSVSGCASVCVCVCMQACTGQRAIKGFSAGGG